MYLFLIKGFIVCKLTEMNRLVPFIILVCLGFNSNLEAQEVSFWDPYYGREHVQQELRLQRTYGGLLSNQWYDSRPLFGKKRQIWDKSIMLTVQNLETDLGFFCRLDQSFDSNMKIPLRLRLGTLDYVNKYEGKNPYAIFPYNN